MDRGWASDNRPEAPSLIRGVDIHAFMEELRLERDLVSSGLAAERGKTLWHFYEYTIYIEMIGF
jgi:hypothetical protein